jgi:hypothetical protein
MIPRRRDSCVRARCGITCCVTAADTPADGEIHQHRISGPEGKMLGMVERSVRIDDTPDGKPERFRLIAAADESLMSEPVALQRRLWLALGVLVPDW